MKKLLSRNLRETLIYLLAVCVPFVMIVKVIEKPAHIHETLFTEKVVYDFLTFYKGVAILTLATIMVVVVVYDLISKNEFSNKIVGVLRKPHNILMGIFALLIIISTVLSSYKVESLLAQYISGEGALHWLAYIIIFIYTQVYLTRLGFEGIGKGLAITSFIVTILGILAYSGKSLFENSSFMSLISPAGLNIEVNDVFYQRFSTIFGNPNHLGTYIAIVMPLMLFYPFEWMKDFKRYCIVNSNLFALIILSKTSAGLLSIFIVLSVSILMYKWIKFRAFKEVVILMGCFIAIYVGVGAITESTLLTTEYEQLRNVTTYKERPMLINNIELSKETITFEFFKDELKLIKHNNGIVFEFNGKQEMINPEVNDSYYEFKNNELDGIKFRMYDSQTMDLIISENQFYVVNKDTTLALYDSYSREFIDEEISFIGFNGYEKFASGRGYIWSRGLSLLKNNLWIGSGADTFAMYFPQHDIEGKILAKGDYYFAVDKPHNAYLYIGHSFGLIALLVFCLSIIMYMVSLINSSNSDRQLLVWKMLSFTAVAIVFMFNDSTVHTGSILWTVMGYNIINRLDD